MSARPGSSSLAEVLDRILDKGIVIDVWARVSVVGIEILTVEARVVAASVDTFLHYAQAVSQIEMTSQSGDLEEMKDLEIGTPTRPSSYEEAPTPR
ncbi:gas vesicle synthesis protein GvpA [Halobacteriales archaeon QS_5_70_15]|nr:MAG: gas vesicle synthesis protein GvpA [Halobacteriales archaeon QS_5_70_15]